MDRTHTGQNEEKKASIPKEATPYHLRTKVLIHDRTVHFPWGGSLRISDHDIGNHFVNINE